MNTIVQFNSKDGLNHICVSKEFLGGDDYLSKKMRSSVNPIIRTELDKELLDLVYNYLQKGYVVGYCRNDKAFLDLSKKYKYDTIEPFLILLFGTMDVQWDENDEDDDDDEFDRQCFCFQLSYRQRPCNNCKQKGHVKQVDDYDIDYDTDDGHIRKVRPCQSLQQYQYDNRFDSDDD